MTETAAHVIASPGHQLFVRELHRALTTEDIREVFFALIGEVVPAEGIGFYLLGGSPVDVREKEATLSQAFLERYEQHGRQDDPVLEFVAEHKLPIDESRAVTEQRWCASGAREALRLEGMVHSMEAPLLDGGALTGTINFAREAGRAFGDVDLLSARFVGEHLSLALERAHRYEAAGARASMFEGAVERIPQAVVVSDVTGAVVHANRAAGRLLQGTRSRPSRLPELLREVVEDFVRRGRKADLAHVKDRVTDRQLIIKSYLVPHKDVVVSMLFERVDEKETALPAWGVLSPREQEIARLVSQGLTTKQIAEQAFVSENTVKQHLKRIFAKTDVHSRAELVQLIWASRGDEAAAG